MVRGIPPRRAAIDQGVPIPARTIDRNSTRRAHPRSRPRLLKPRASRRVKSAPSHAQAVCVRVEGNDGSPLLVGDEVQPETVNRFRVVAHARPPWPGRKPWSRILGSGCVSSTVSQRPDRIDTPIIHRQKRLAMTSRPLYCYLPAHEGSELSPSMACPLDGGGR
jgi:hypothetical protein